VNHRIHAVLVTLGILFISLELARPALSQEIWFAPPAAPEDSRLHRAVDFMDLFSPDAPWQQAASHVKVFMIYGSYLSRAPQHEVDRIVGDLNRRGIPLALAVGVMNVGPRARHPACGGLGMVEGYGVPSLARNQAGKIKRAGGAIRFIAMDEPLWFGHYFKGKPGGQPGCHSSIQELLQLIREPLAVYAEEFPGIVVGETEPTDIAEQDHWKEDVSAWASGFRNQYGHALAFTHLDIPFNRPGEEGYAVDYYHYIEKLQQQGLIGAIGVIYDGTPTDSSDEAWVLDAKEHIHLIEDKHGLRPNQALIQSWQAYPQHVLPESSAGSLTGLVNYYAARVK
jgi:hypothetical protein